MNTRKNITRWVMSLHLALFIILPVCTFQGGLQVSAASVSGTIAKSYFFQHSNVFAVCRAGRARLFAGIVRWGSYSGLVVVLFGGVGAGV